MLTEAMAKKGVGCSFHRVGQLHATDLVVLCGAQHARFGIGFVRIVCGLRQDDFFAVKVGFLRVHQSVIRGVFFAGNAFASVEHRVKGFSRVVGKALAALQGVDLEPVVQQKINGVAKRHMGLNVESWGSGCGVD